jgi:hypothetical protein
LPEITACIVVTKNDAPLGLGALDSEREEPLNQKIVAREN